MSRIVFLLSALCLQSAFGDVQSVRTAPIIQRVVDQTVRTFGVLAPTVEEMSFQIPGRIAQFSVDEGDRVSEGQLLVSLESKDAEDELRRTESEMSTAGTLLDSVKTLHGVGSIPSTRLTETQAHYDQLRISYEQAALNVARCYLKAPADGVILKQIIDSRTSVSPGEPVFIFQSDDEPWITKIDLTDRNALLMSRDAVAHVRFSPYPNEIFSGKVTKVARVANPADGLYTAEVAIRKNGFELRPGMVAEVDLVKTSDKEFSVVPLDALLDLRDDQGTIYVVAKDGQTAREVQVTINSISGSEVALAEDVSEYSRVIIRGHQDLQDQSPIAILD